MGSHNIEVSVRGVLEQKIAEAKEMKFVVADDPKKRNVVLGQHGMPAPYEHKDLIPPDAHFIGAGVIRARGSFLNVQWGSGSCQESFGYDRPADTAEAQEVRTEVKSAVQDWLQKVLTK